MILKNGEKFEQMRGEITIQLLDKDSMEIEQEISAENTATWDTFTKAAHVAGYMGTNIQTGSGTDYMIYTPTLSNQSGQASMVNGLVVAVSDAKITPDLVSVYQIPYGTMRTKGTSVINNWTYYYVSPGSFYMERKDRFDVPTTTRTINTVFLSNSSTYNYGSSAVPPSYNTGVCDAYVGLTTPCVQTPTQVMDIVYRLHFTYNEASVTPPIFAGSTISKIRPESLMKDEFFQYMYNGSTASYPHREQLFYTPFVPPEGQYANLAENNADYFTVNLGGSAGKFRNSHTMSVARTSEIGNLFGMFSVCGTGTGTAKRSIFAFKAAPDTFIKKPVQPIFNHSEVAPTPFLNVDYLASSQGTMNVYDNGWIQDGASADLWRVDISDTGDVGTSGYFLRKRKTIGFDGANYNSRRQVVPWVSGQVDTFARTYYGKDGHIWNVEEYSVDPNYLVGWNKSGINMFNLGTGENVIFDSIGFPTLQVSSIYQVSCDEIGNIWVADNVSGLFKIENPLSASPVISHMITDPCYGVDVGFQDRVWTVSSTGVKYSTNYGTSWTDVTVTWTGLTSTWNNARFVRADRSDSNHNIVIVYNNPADSNVSDQRMYVAWTNPTGTTTSGGGPFYRLMYTTGSQTGYPRTGKLRCSLRGSFWVVINSTSTLTATYAQALQLIPHATPETLFIGSTISDHFPSHSNVCFLYDKQDNPYTLSTGGGIAPHQTVSQWTAHYGYTGVYSKDRERGIVGVLGKWMIGPEGNGQVAGHYVITPERRDKGTALTSDGTTLRIENIHPPGLQSNVPLSGRLDSLGGKFSIMSDFVWDTFKWNGSQWEDGFQSTISNSGQTGGQLPKTGFVPGSYQFTGLSSISSPVSIPSSMTLAFTLKTESKILLTASRTHTVVALKSPTATTQLCVDGVEIPASGRFNTLSLARSSSGTCSILTGSVPHDNSEPRYVLIGGLQSVKKSYGAGVFKQANGGKTHAATFTSTNTSATSTPNMFSATNGVETFSAVKLQDGVVSLMCSFPDYVDSGYYDGAGYSVLGQFYKYFGVSTISPTIPELQTNNFDIEFVRKNASSVRWNDDNHTDCRFSLMINFSETPTTASTSGPFTRITTSATKKYLNISFRYDQNSVAVSPGVIGAPRLYSCNGSSAETFVDFTLVSPSSADDFNGTNKTIVQYRYNSGTQRYTVDILSEDSQSKLLTTLWTASPVALFATPSPGIVSVHQSHYHTGYWNSGVPIAHRGVELLGFSITNFHDFNTLVPVTVPGSVFNVYRNGVSVGALSIDGDLSSTTEVIIGNKSTDSDSGLRGTLKNFQLWDTAWDATDIANDAANPTGKISSKPANNCLIHLPLTGSLIGTEVKATHTVQEDMPDNLQIKFNAGTISPAFVAKDHFTVGVYDGIFKDDATSFDQSYITHTRPTKSGMDYVENATTFGTTASTIISPMTVTEPVAWHHGFSRTHARGQVSSTAQPNNWAVNYGASGLQSTSGDCSLSFTVGTDKSYFMCGLTNDTSTVNQYTNIDYAINLGYNGGAGGISAIFVFENGTQRGGSGFSYGTFDVNDVFTITRTGTTVTYSKNGTVFYTSLVPAAGTFFPRMNYYAHAVLYDCIFTYTQPYPTAYLGNSLTEDGSFNKYFYQTDDIYVKVMIDGVDAPVVKYDYPNVNPTVWPIPAEGSCVFVGFMGVLYFNPADVGKTVEVEYTTIYFK